MHPALLPPACAMPLLFAATLVSLPVSATPASYRIAHLEPMSWWAGMRHPALQLMVHGERIADLQPAIDYPGVRIAGTTRVANPNYLFIDLELARDVRPGSFAIAFRPAGQAGDKAPPVLTHEYRLLPRAPGSRERQGFGGRDAIYQVMPDRFANGDLANDSATAMADKANRAAGGGRHGGDLAGMAAHLGYVAEMGFTQVWPTPLLENDMPAYSYHGYAATDFYRIDRRYGGNEDFRAFVAAARGKGIGVIQDVVLNHIGAGHWWMKDLPMPDWIGYGGKPVLTKHHRVANGDPYGSRADARNFTEGWFSRGMPDLNQANPFMATYLIQNTIWWIEYAGLSGLRIDTYGYSNNAFLTEWSRRVLDEYPNLNLVGEEWSTRVPVVARWQQGKQNHDGYLSHMPSMMDFPLNDALRRALASPVDEKGVDSNHGTFSLNDLYETLAQDHLYPAPQDLVLFEGNHDLPRTWSVLNEDMGLWRMAMAYLATAPRIPQFYYGTEILMPSTTQGRDDASYRHDFPGGWPGDRVNAFTGAGLTAAQREAQAYLKKLLNWRKGATVVHGGRTMHFGPEQDTYVLFRYDGTRKVVLALNKNPKPVTLDTGRFGEMLDGVATGTDVITGQTFNFDRGIALPARTAIILELK
ncbi:glycoside hydrolase family 13 protein [Pseudoduganella albidiflava]|uniref:Glycosyl hydrolase n=2 Tax=Pseudoduganella albidiflava TaxID=321983 RepID=A0AA87Y357_9BURK|nr:glycoside hydrolase family 13 protein [Pseudoduganella albidiflava]GGY63418.1 glycosyl hydrolase [Pseudoduganella albidiflava]